MVRPFGLLSLLFVCSALADPLVPYLVKDLNPETTTRISTPRFDSGHSVGNTLYFHAQGDEAGLWRTNGTRAGTYRIYDGIEDDHYFYGGGTITENGGEIFFPVGTTHPLWKSPNIVRTDLIATDGTTSGTRFVATVPSYSLFAACGRKICFTGSDALFGFTDGTEEGSGVLSTAPAVELGGRPIVSLGDRVLFNALDAERGQCMEVYTNFGILIVQCGELWTSDGTVEGTQRFLDLNPGRAPSAPRNFFRSTSGVVYFSVVTPGERWCQVWATDGTPAGTGAVMKGMFSCGMQVHFHEAGGRVFFLGLFRDILQTEGTLESTVSFRERFQWPEGRNLSDMKAFGSLLLFTTEYLNQKTLSVYDGTTVTDLTPVDGYVRFLDELPAQRRLYFIVEADGNQLWSTDGTPAGTRKHFILPPTEFGTKSAFGATHDRVFYIAGTEQLWTTDGTEAGTYKLELTEEVGSGSTPGPFLPEGEKAFFTAVAPLKHGLTDGTAEGTVFFADAAPSSPMFRHEGRIYFRDAQSVLWTTDGTAAGTRRAAEWLGATRVDQPAAFLDDSAIFAEGARFDATLVKRDASGRVEALDMRGEMQGFVSIAGRVLFWHRANVQSAWTIAMTDGTRSGTKTLASNFAEPARIVPMGTKAYFVNIYASAGTWTVWNTDLTPEGTRQVEVISGDGNVDVVPLLIWRDAAYFVVAEPGRYDSYGGILWRTDGTEEGTYRVCDAHIRNVIVEGDGLTLLGFPLGASSLEIWRSDGTPEGTVRRVQETVSSASYPFPLPGGGHGITYLANRREMHIRNTLTDAVAVVDLGDVSPSRPIALNGRLLFGGERPRTGWELWAIDFDGATRVPPASVGIEYRGTVATGTGRGAMFRVRMESRSSARPTVVASTVDGTLISGSDYVPFTKEIVFEGDHDVTLVVPLKSNRSGTVSVMLTDVKDGVIARGMATAVVPSRRPVVRH